MKFTFPVRVYLVALILRLIPVLLTLHLGIGLDDMFQYDMLARSLASGNGFRWYAQEDLKLLEPYVDFDLSTAQGYDPHYGMYTSFRAPLYPAFLAFVYYLSGLEFSRFFVARLAQAFLLGAPLAPLTYLVALRFFASSESTRERTARLSAWIVAVYPILLVYPLGLATENLFFVVLLSAFLFLLRASTVPTTVNFVLAGIFLALAALTRSVILPFAGLAMLYLFYLYRTKMLAVVIVFILMISPWILRNTLLHGKLTGIETSMGYNLYLGYHPDGNGSFIFGPSLDLLTIMDDSERDAVGTQKAIEFIRAEPERFFPLALNRLGFFFGLEKRVVMYFYSNNILGYIPAPFLLMISLILLLPFVLICIFGVMGLAVLRRSTPVGMLYLLFAAYILPHVFILAEDRFHLTLVPFIAILASYAIMLIRTETYKTMTHHKVWLLTFVLILFLALNWGYELRRDADKISTLFSLEGNRSYFTY